MAKAGYRASVLSISELCFLAYALSSIGRCQVSVSPVQLPKKPPRPPVSSMPPDLKRKITKMNPAERVPRRFPSFLLPGL